MNDLYIAIMSILVAACAAAIYFTSSFLLLRYPLLLHKKKQIKFTCRHIAHRGGAGENLENTISAFEHAIRCGSEMLEIDCQLTLDGQVVVAHDNHLLRIAGIDQFICNLNYKELPEIKNTLPLDFNKEFSVVSKILDRRIPLLSELFEKFPIVPINIDIKLEDQRLIDAVNSLVTKFRRENLTVWGNFRDSVCQRCYLTNPQIPLLFSLKRVVQLVLLFYTGLLPFMPLKESFLEILMPSVFIDNVHVTYNPTGRQIFVLKMIDSLLMSKRLFDHLRRRGIQVYIWVLNNEIEYSRAFECGATGVMTDFPLRLQKFLQENPHYGSKWLTPTSNSFDALNNKSN